MVKPGYKQTEIGVIPETWHPCTIGDVATFSGGAQPPRSTFVFKQKAGYIRLIQIRDYKTDVYETYIPETLAKKKCTKNDIMIGRYGPPIFQILRGIEGAYNVALLKAIPSNKIEKEYLYHFLRNDALFNLIEMLSQRSSGQTGIELPALRDYPLPLPPLPEQRAIAEALSDVDALIAALDKLIAKKQAIKTATMQELLTGKKRLPGFSGKWLQKMIGEFADCTAGGTPSTAIESYWGGNIKWMSSGELHLKFVSDVAGRITEAGLRNSSTHLIPANCVLIGLAGQGKTRGTVAMNTVELCTNQSIAAILPNETFVPEYLYYNLDNRYVELRGLSTGDGGRGGLNLTIIRNISIPFPLIEEQRTIAKVLSDLDTEIGTLEIRRRKTQVIKQGMMQELLTGRTRLI